MATPNMLPLVRAIKADLIARGTIPAQQTTNDHSAAILVRLAWQTEGLGAMLIRKSPAQNGAWLTIRGERVKVSHDSLNYPDGNVDALVGAGPEDNLNTPAWMWKPGRHALSDADAIAPFDPEAGIDLPPAPPAPPPPAPLPPPVETFPPESALPTIWSTAEFGTLEWMADMGRALSLGYHILLHRPKAQPTDFLGALNWLKHIVIDKRDPAFVWAAIRTSGEYKALHP
jgi:hypothetical protein